MKSSKNLEPLACQTTQFQHEHRENNGNTPDHSEFENWQGRLLKRRKIKPWENWPSINRVVGLIIKWLDTQFLSSSKHCRDLQRLIGSHSWILAAWQSFFGITTHRFTVSVPARECDSMCNKLPSEATHFHRDLLLLPRLTHEQKAVSYLQRPNELSCHPLKRLHC